MKKQKRAQKHPAGKGPAGLPRKKMALPAQGQTAPFPIVGIGASAGGLAAFERFLSAMPSGSVIDMAFILVQHLAPNHKSLLTELIQRYTTMQVFEATDGIKVERNCAYIIPPNSDIALLHGKLQVLEPTLSHGQRLPINFLFRSLAQDQRNRAICIVLSGTGSDGTLGLREVKAEGGLVLAQIPESTEYDGMPRSAIATGLVDYILPPEKMVGQILLHLTHLHSRTLPSVALTEIINKIFILLRDQTGHDFSLYKRNTITRRIDRRMAVQQIKRLPDYVRFLQDNAQEVSALFHDLLIGVNSFFRDAANFKMLQKRAIAPLVKNQPAGASIRIWVPGCSSGEEAYSIAILLQESREASSRGFKVQIFATDIDSRAIALARMGTYSSSAVSNISAHRLAYFFTKTTNGAYRINKSIRDMVIFSEQDVIKDPPFSKLDLISCRNLLIYMNGELQKRLIPLFYYSLNSDGHLFLGASETVGEFPDLFAPLERKASLYRRKYSRDISARVLANAPADRSAAAPALKAMLPQANDDVRTLTEAALLKQHPMTALLVTERGEIQYIHGRSGQYLEPAPGKSAMNVLKMAREGLRQELAFCLRRAAEKHLPISRSGLRVKTNGDYTSTDLTVRCLPKDSAGSAPCLFLIILEPTPADPKGKAWPEHAPQPMSESARNAMLAKELREKEAFLQSATEELASSNEELQSSNEEMQSVNEELQSTNEELETAKEELQSVNEELSTVNTELQAKVSDLTQSNNDMSNLMLSTGVGTIFVDHQMNILRFTAAATQVINLIPVDVGRPISDIVSNLIKYDRLLEDMQAVLDTLVPKEVEVQSKTGIWYQLRIRPYRTLENVIEGAVLTFIDISEIKRAQETLHETAAMRHLAGVARDSKDAIIVQDLEGRILTWNATAERTYGWPQAEALAMNIRDIIPAALRREAQATVRQLGHAEIIEPYHTQRLAKNGQIVEAWLTATALVDSDGETYAIATTERPVRESDNARKA